VTRLPAAVARQLAERFERGVFVPGDAIPAMMVGGSTDQPMEHPIGLR
jgi:hypothetical protein